MVCLQRVEFEQGSSADPAARIERRRGEVKMVKKVGETVVEQVEDRRLESLPALEMLATIGFVTSGCR